MILDSSTLPVTAFGSFVNAFGLAVPLVTFAALPRNGLRRAFSLWSASYGLMLAAVLMMGQLEPWAFPAWLVVCCCLSYAASTAAMLHTALAIGERAGSQRPAVMLTLLTLAASLGLLAFGQPFSAATIPLALGNMGAHILVGVRLLQHWETQSLLVRGVAIWTVAAGLWVLAYPPLAAAHLTWLGYIVAGINHAVVGIGVAVILLHENQRRLELQHQQLRAVDRVKTDFIANLSHELRTPLTSIKLAAWMLRNEHGRVGEAGAGALLEDLSQQTDHLIKVVNTLIDFSAQELGKLPVEKHEGELACLVAAEVETFRPRFEARGIDLRHAGCGPVKATFDATRIKQVVENVLENALKFTPAHGTVAVSLQADGTFARLDVEDSGPGIPDDMRSAVFERYFQLEGGTVGKTAGLGIGLALCKSIVEGGHAGRMWAESPPQGGCRMVIELPLNQTAEAVPTPVS